MRPIQQQQQQNRNDESWDYAPLQQQKFLQFLPAIAQGVGLLSGAFGSKSPKAVYQKPTNPIDIARDTISGNAGLLPKAQGLAADISTGEADLLTQLMEKQIPGFASMQGKLTARANEAIDNPYSLPQEVQDNLTRLSAEKGLTVGARGEFEGFSALRDLGVNMLDYGNSRIQQAQSIWSLVNSVAPKVNPVSPLAFLPTTGQAINADVSNKANNQATAQSAANAASQQQANQQNAYGQAFGAFSQFLTDRYGSKPAGTTDTAQKAPVF